jgi:Nitroreductase family
MPDTNHFNRPAGNARGPLTTLVRDDRELVRSAALAASSHNTQPWRFRVTPNEIMIVSDLSRRCPAADPDDAHLYKSLGCAAENLVQAAAAQGLAAVVRFDVSRDAVVVGLSPSSDVAPSALFEAITSRQSTRLPFDGTPVVADELALLESAGRGPGVRAMIVTDRARLGGVSDLVARGNIAQLTDRAFRRELVSWIRFNDTAAVRSGDGLAGRCNGNPSLPTWIGKILAPFVIRARSQVDRDRKSLESSAGIAVFVAADDDKPAWVETGRAYQRFALQAAALDIRTAFINQPVEVPSLRPELETLLELQGEHALLAVRFGHGVLAPYSQRRPVEDVIDR